VSALRAVVVFEARLLRWDLLWSALLLGAVLVVRGFVPAGSMPAGGSGPMALMAFVFLMLLAVTRTVASAGSWGGGRGHLPLPRVAVVLGETAVRAGFAFFLAAAFVTMFPVAGGHSWGRLAFAGLWILTLLTAYSFGRILQRAHAGPGTLLLAAGLPPLLLVDDLRQLVWAGVAGGGHMLAAGGLFVLLLSLIVLRIRLQEAEWLPRQSPKAVALPRSPLARFRRRRRQRPRTPGQVLRMMKNDVPVALQVSISCYVVAIWLLADDRSTRGFTYTPGPWSGPLVVGVIGFFVLGTLERKHKTRLLLHAWPVSWLAIWLPTLLGLLGAAGLAIFIGLHPWDLEPEARLSADYWPFATRLAHGVTRYDPLGGCVLLRAPPWITAVADVRERPAGMPPPVRGVGWPLRGDPQADGSLAALVKGPTQPIAAQLEDPPTYFRAAMHYYLHLVYGIRVSDADLDEALGPPYVGGEAGSPRWDLMGVNPMAEYMRSGDDQSCLPPPFRRGYQLRFRDEPKVLEAPILVYAFGPAIERLQRALGPRLRRAMLWGRALEVLLALLAILLFVRCGLIGGALRWTLPLVPLFVIGWWCGQRATAAHLALRDAFLAHPRIALVLAAAAAGVLVVSIRRALERRPT